MLAPSFILAPILRVAAALLTASQIDNRECGGRGALPNHSLIKVDLVSMAIPADVDLKHGMRSRGLGVTLGEGCASALVSKKDERHDLVH